MTKVKEIKKWIKVLRSGTYKQTTCDLQNQGGHCCLGVACDIFIPRNKMSITNQNYMAGALPKDQKFAPKWLKDINKDFESLLGVGLEALNDNGLSNSDHYNLIYPSHDHNNPISYKTDYSLKRFSFDEIADLLQLVYVEGALK